ncbi:MAG TPA: hypothetical protein VFS20_20925 [Longimicrobium sp.]|nr:hypothetical protein [Longimicrobium sp.]
MTRIRSTLGLLALAVLPFAAQPAEAQQVYWRGRSGGYDIAWSARDITARRVSDGALVFSARRMADAEVASMQDEHDENVPLKEFERRVRLLSVAGSIISLEEESYCDCGGAHPILWTRFASYDVARGSVANPHPLAATDLVAEAELLRALQADRLIRQAMANAGVRAFTSLRGLVNTLGKHEVRPPNDQCTYGVGERFPSEFALHHLENGRVALRFSLGHWVEVCRGKLIQLGVLVTPRARLLPDLNAANARRAGYLMKDVATIAREHETILNYQPRRGR